MRAYPRPIRRQALGVEPFVRAKGTDRESDESVTWIQIVLPGMVLLAISMVASVYFGTRTPGTEPDAIAELRNELARSGMLSE